MSNKKKPSSVISFLPQWSKRAALDESGRDPLGLSRVIHLITDNILPGIITTTFRARYYSFFCWGLASARQSANNKNPSQFWESIRRREAAIVLATLIHRAKTNGPERHIDGLRQGTKYLALGQSEGAYECDFQALPSNKRGAFGQYYEGSMNKLGLTGVDEKGYESILADGRATRLVEAFAGSIAKTPWFRKKAYDEDLVTVKIMDDSAEYLSLDSLDQAWASGEQKELIRLFFSNDLQQPDESAYKRRQSLLLMLHIIESASVIGNKLKMRSFSPISSEGLLAPIYFGELLRTPNKTVRYQCPATLVECRAMWEQYAQHHYVTLALESLFQAILDTCNAHPSGLTIPELVKKLTGQKFIERLHQETQLAKATPQAYLRWLGSNDVPPAKIDSTCFAQNARFLSPRGEQVSIQAGDDTPSSNTLRAMGTLLRLYLRWRNRRSEPAFRQIEFAISGDIWMAGILDIFDQLISENAQWPELVSYFLKLVVSRHEDVWMGKRFRQEARWLEYDGKQVRHLIDYQPQARDSRWQNALYIMRDLGLIQTDEETGIELTLNGKKLLEALL